MDCDQGQPQRSNWRGGCVITTGGAYLNDREENGQIGRSNDVWDAGDDENAESTTQFTHGYRGTPPSAVVHAVPEFICGMSAYVGVSSKFHSFKVLVKFNIIPRIKRYKPKKHIFWLKAKTLH